MLIAGRKLPVLKQFKYPIWIEVMGWMVVAMMGSMSIVALIQQFG
jgi:Mn2+/Fe2+ NRAMP family transporter